MADTTTGDNLNIYAAEPSATGACLVAPRGTEAPKSATDKLHDDFVDLGHIGEDGFTETIDRDIDRKKDFGGKTVKVLQTDYSHQLKFVLLESLNADVLKAVYGKDNVKVEPANDQHGTQIEVNKKSSKLPHMAWVIDTVDSELGANYRNYCYDAQLVETGDVTISHTDTIEYEVTLEVFEDPEGNYVRTFTDDGRKASAS